MEMTGYIQSTQNRNLVIFLEYIKKKVLQIILCSIVIQNMLLIFGSFVVKNGQHP